MANLFRTGLLLAALTALFMALGYWIAGKQGMIVALLAAGATNFFAYWGADRAILALYGAREIEEAQAPALVSLVRDLSHRAGVPTPRLYIIENDQPNAFATGRNPDHAALAVTSGLLRLLSEQETAGVLGHELAHVRNRDTLTMTVTATLAGAIGMLANFGLLFGAPRDGNGERGHPLGPVGGLIVLLLAPLVAVIVQMAISRAREYAADRGGAAITGHPLSLAQALSKIESYASELQNDVAERNPATAHLFIVNPLGGLHLDNLFSTHPPTTKRIARLEAMAHAQSPWANRRPF